MKALTKPRRRTKTVKLRTNGKHKVDAASTIKIPTEFGPLSRILRPQSQFRWLMPNLAAITPQYIEMTLMGAMQGNNVQQWELFDLMLKSWPELLECYTELVQGVMRKKLIFEPYCDEDEEPTPVATERAKLVSTALRRMQPEPTRDDCNLEGTIEDILDAWFRGVSVSEIVWQMLDDNTIGTIAAPKSTFWVHPCNYGFDTTATLGLRSLKDRYGATVWPFTTTSTQANPARLEPFPEHKFLIAMHKSSGGSVLGGPLLRPLAWWWCAANFSSDWLLNLAQVFGLPFRWANYDTNAPQATIDAICTMLQNMGSAGWAAFPVGTTLELVQPTGSQGSDHSPQGELLDRADRYARSLILGQTMTGTHGTTGKGGGQAFGTVEADVKSDRIEAAGKFAAEVINEQFIPSILMLNYGDTEERPSIRFLEDEEAGTEQAQMFKTLADAGVEIGVDHLRKTFNIPPPGEGEETIGGEPEMPPGFNALPGFDQQPPNEQDTEEEPATAGDAPGHPFRGNQYTEVQRKGYEPIFDPEKGIFTFPEIAGSPEQVDRDIAALAIERARIKNETPVVLAVRDVNGVIHYGAPAEVHASAIQRLGWGPERLWDRGHVRLTDNKYFPMGGVEGGDHKHWKELTKGKQTPSDRSRFPSITQSAEDQRRRELNAQLHTKLIQLGAIKDDAVFGRALVEIAEGK